jgi:hypothetical protein
MRSVDGELIDLRSRDGRFADWAWHGRARRRADRLARFVSHRSLSMMGIINLG